MNKKEFRANVKLEGRCWIWQRGKQSMGYGALYVDGRQRLAHRHAYILYVGPIPKGKFILHKCDMPACVNPKHLYVGGYLENNRDTIKRGRRKRNPRSATHCTHGHKLTEANVYRWAGTPNARICKQCKLIHHKQWLLRHKGD